jgi:hypothetical protein
MRIPLTVVMVTGLIVSGCGFGQSRLNPVNWFGKSTEIGQPVVDAGTVNPLLPEQRTRNGLFSRPDAADTSVLIQSVSGLKIEPTSSGAIIYASGIAARQGAFAAELRPKLENAPGELNLDFRVVYPASQTASGSEQTRTVNAAYKVSSQELAALKLIRVNGATNGRETRRK